MPLDLSANQEFGWKLFEEWLAEHRDNLSEEVRGSLHTTVQWYIYRGGSMWNASQAGWLAGMIEGEGSFSATAYGPRVQFGSTDRDVVAKVAFLICGEVSGGIQRFSDKGVALKPMYYTSKTGVGGQIVMEELRPLMSERRQQQIDDIIYICGLEIPPDHADLQVTKG